MLIPNLPLKAATPSPGSTAEGLQTRDMTYSMSGGYRRPDVAAQILETLRRHFSGADVLPKETLTRLLDALIRTLRSPNALDGRGNLNQRLATLIEVLPQDVRAKVERQIMARTVENMPSRPGDSLRATVALQRPPTSPSIDLQRTATGSPEPARGPLLAGWTPMRTTTLAPADMPGGQAALQALLREAFGEDENDLPEAIEEPVSEEQADGPAVDRERQSRSDTAGATRGNAPPQASQQAAIPAAQSDGIAAAALSTAASVDMVETLTDSLPSTEAETFKTETATPGETPDADATVIDSDGTYRVPAGKTGEADVLLQARNDKAGDGASQGRPEVSAPVAQLIEDLLTSATNAAAPVLTETGDNPALLLQVLDPGNVQDMPASLEAMIDDGAAEPDQSWTGAPEPAADPTEMTETTEPRRLPAGTQPEQGATVAELASPKATPAGEAPIAFPVTFIPFAAPLPPVETRVVAQEEDESEEDEDEPGDRGHPDDRSSPDDGDAQDPPGDGGTDDGDRSRSGEPYDLYRLLGGVD